MTSCGRALGKNDLIASTSHPSTSPTTPIHVGRKPDTEHVTFLSWDHPMYEQLRQGFNKAIQKHPRIIALCRSTQGVSEAIQYAQHLQLPVAIKSGGHSFEGFSCNDDGLVINLSLMNYVEWRDRTTVKVGPACKLSQLYDAMLPKKRILPTGSCGSVGIAGLTLGGGYGFFSRKYGLTCDSLIEVTVVDGNGKIHSSKDDPELLWACRGGGNGNFGVVSEMVFKTHPAPAAFQSHRFKVSQLDAERANHILQRWFEVAGKLPESCFSAYVLNGKTLTILVTDFEARTREIQGALNIFRSLMEKTSPGSPTELSRALKVYYGRQTQEYFKNASAGLYKGYDEIRPYILDILEIVVQRSGLIYQVNTLGGKIADQGLESLSCYPHRRRPFLAELQAYWEAPGKETQLLKRVRAIQELFHQHSVSAHYVNYPNVEFQDWEQAYYADNYARLQVVKRRYDPENVIRHEQSVRI